MYISTNIYTTNLHGGLLAMIGYDLLSELPTIKSEHVTIVPGDTMVFGDKVEVKSA